MQATKDETYNIKYYMHITKEKILFKEDTKVRKK